MDRTELGNALKKIANEVWAANQRPLLVSDISAQLNVHCPEKDYKVALGKGSLKSFILATGAEFGYKLILHPTQQAKLGLAPANVEFAFPDEPVNTRAGEPSVNKKEDGIALMQLLAKLPDSDLEKMSIPISILAKYFR